jgi:hypothetical protein
MLLAIFTIAGIAVIGIAFLLFYFGQLAQVTGAKAPEKKDD